jgi:hypothetical protein
VCCAPSYLENADGAADSADLAFHDVLTSVVYSKT